MSSATLPKGEMKKLYGPDLIFVVSPAQVLIERMERIESRDYYAALLQRIGELFPTGAPKFEDLARSLPAIEIYDRFIMWSTLTMELLNPPPVDHRWRRVIQRWEAKHRGAR